MKNNVSGVLVLVGLSLSAAYAADSLQKGEMKGETKGETRKTEPMKKPDTMKTDTTRAEGIVKMEHVVLVPAQELKWVDEPDAPGVKTAVVEGDAKKGPHHAYHRFKAGFDMPAHHHSADYYGTVIAGTMVMTLDGKEYRAMPGSYFSFTAKQKHGTRCDTGSDCTVFLDARGAWDVVPEKAVKAGR